MTREEAFQSGQQWGRRWYFEAEHGDEIAVDEMDEEELEHNALPHIDRGQAKREDIEAIVQDGAAGLVRRRETSPFEWNSDMWDFLVSYPAFQAAVAADPEAGPEITGGCNTGLEFRDGFIEGVRAAAAESA